MAIYPTPEQIEAFLQHPFPGPVQMLNLLKFKERAEYEDGRETTLSGREAYQLYAEQVVPYIVERGGRIVHSAEAGLLMIGEGQLQWDLVAMVEYPSKEEFGKLLESPEVAGFSVHRSAGLAYQLLVACSPTPFG